MTRDHKKRQSEHDWLEELLTVLPGGKFFKVYEDEEATWWRSNSNGVGGSGW